jgi:hypothetical protein
VNNYSIDGLKRVTFVANDLSMQSGHSHESQVRVKNWRSTAALSNLEIALGLLENLEVLRDT